MTGHPLSRSRLATLWRTTRRYLPPPVLRLLAPLHRLSRQAHLRRMAEEDRELPAAERQAVPPAALRFKVGGPATIPDFRAAGEGMAASLEAAVCSLGRSLAAGGEFLDFGCGCGRLLAAVERRFPQLGVTGCDVDAEAVAWCRDRFPAMAFHVTDEWPQREFPDASFDVIWCGSVFTHIDEAHQDAWLADLRRMLRPGGLLVASVHGRRSWEKWPPFWGRGRLEREGFFFLASGVDAGLHPGWYQVTWHTEAYVRRHWSRWYEIRGYHEAGLNGYQDLVLAVPR